MSSSLILSLSAKLSSVRKLALRYQTLGMFSSSSSTTTNPYLMYGTTIYGNPEEDLHVRSDIHYFDPVKENEVIVRDKTLPMEFRKECVLGGMSHGWVVFKARSDDKKDKVLYISDYYTPCGSKSNPKTIPLHPMGQQLGRPAQYLNITNVAMTCSPDQSNDFAVAVNCLGPVINFFLGLVASTSTLVRSTLPLLSNISISQRLCIQSVMKSSTPLVLTANSWFTTTLSSRRI
uniref:Uncharacterized protein n=1 Tax=Brassica campestris TaxID=3711 RepID=A0A3P6A849_BRACM|nr:unnamed protein product [Brassica rapa]